MLNSIFTLHYYTTNKKKQQITNSQNNKIIPKIVFLSYPVM